MSDAPETSATETADAMTEFMSTLRQLLLDQRKINVVLASLVRDQSKRLELLEDRPIQALAADEQAAVASKAPVIGRDVPAYPTADLEFLKRSTVFEGLSDDALRVILYKGELKHAPQGYIIFDIGSPSDALHIIKEGVVEISRPVDDPDDMKTVAFFTNSDTIGEMRIITQSPHRSRGRMPGGGEIFILRRDAFIELMEIVPELAIRMCEMYAHKLEGTVSSLRRHEQQARPLEGNLEYFDLATVIQTLLSTDQRTGLLSVSDDKQQTVAELFIDKGRVLRASMGKLRGEDAFYQLFQSDIQRGTFFFNESVKAEEALDDDEDEIEVPGMSLLMEAARLQDELSEIRELINTPRMTFNLRKPELEWEEEETRVLAEGVLRAVKNGQNVQYMLDNLPKNEHAIYSTLQQLIDTEHIAPSEEFASAMPKKEEKAEEEDNPLAGLGLEE